MKRYLNSDNDNEHLRNGVLVPIPAGDKAAILGPIVHPATDGLTLVSLTIARHLLSWRLCLCIIHRITDHFREHTEAWTGRTHGTTAPDRTFYYIGKRKCICEAVLLILLHTGNGHCLESPLIMPASDKDFISDVVLLSYVCPNIANCQRSFRPLHMPFTVSWMDNNAECVLLQSRASICQ